MKNDIKKIKFCLKMLKNKKLNFVRTILLILKTILGFIILFISGTIADVFGSEKIYIYLFYWAFLFILISILDAISYILYKGIYRNTYSSFLLLTIKNWLAKSEKERKTFKTNDVLSSVSDDCGIICDIGINSIFNITLLLIDLVIAVILLCRYNILFIVIVGLFSFLEVAQIQKRFYKKQNIYEKENFRTNSEVSTWTKGIFERFEHLKIFNLTNWSKKIILGKINENYKIRTKQNVASTVIERLKYLPAWICETIFYMVGGILIIKGSFSLGSLITSIGLMSKCLKSTTSISSFLKKLKINFNAYDRLEKYGLFIDSAKEDKEDFIFPQIDQNSKINIKSVSFSYEDIAVFDKINISIPLKGVLLLKGDNGSGKSTLLSLLMGVNKPDLGDVTINGINTKTMTIDMYNKVYSCAFQDGAILGKSIAENICFFSDFDEKRFNDVYDNVFKDLRQLDFREDLNTLGGNISGGEKKRILLARSLYKDSRVLVLDEIDANLDDEGMQKLISFVKKVSADKLVIIVTHRFKAFLDNGLVSYVIDTNEFPIRINYLEDKSAKMLLSLSHTLSNNGKTKIITINVTGSSMQPTYFQGEQVNILIGKFEICKGNIVLFYGNNKMILHRIVGFRENSVICKGDNNLMSELVDIRKIIGKVIEKCKRDGGLNTNGSNYNNSLY